MHLPSRMRRTGLLIGHGSILAALFLVASIASAQRLPSSIIVRIVPGVTAKSAREMLLASGGGVTVRPLLASTVGGRSTLAANRLDRYLVVESASAGAARLLGAYGGSPIVEEAFENHRYHLDAAPNDSLYGEQWALAKVEAEEAWKGTVGDSSVTIGVLDTGIDFTHPDLTGAMAINAAEDINHNGAFEPWLANETRGGIKGDLDGIDQDGNGYADDVLGYDFVDQTVQNAGDWSGRDPIPADELGHGTNVAGVIGARRDNMIGVSGLAPGCRLVALRAFDVGGNGEDDDIAAALVYGADRGVKVINLSFGDYYYSPLLRDAVRYAHEKGVTIVASSGNEGGTSPHYPSSFPEVISVGSTDQNDFLSSFSTYGGQLSLCAPGSDIITTNLDSGYKKVSGTSFSAPMVSAAAGLLASLHRTWTPDEIRTVLELSSDDRGRAGWDINYGAGRLNARRAVTFPGPAALAILSPEGDGGLRGDAMSDVIGSAFSPIIESWELMIGEGDEPKEWTELTSPDRFGRVREKLGAIRPSDFGSGLHTLRLRLKQTNGRETERRVRLFLNQTKPVIERHALQNVWHFDERAIALTLTTDQLTLLTVWVRRADEPAGVYRAASLEPVRTGWVRDHYLFLTGPEIEAGIPYSLYAVARNAAGDTAMIGSPSAPLEIVRGREGFSLTTLLPKPYALPYGYALNQTVRLYSDGHPCLALNRFAGGSYGKLMLYSFDGKSFTARDSIAESWIPRGFGDSDGNSLLELLAQASGSGEIFEQEGPNGRLFARSVYVDTTSGDFWGDGLYDFDGDGKDEVIARTDNAGGEPAHYYVARRDGRTLTTIATLPNTTAPADGDERNKYGPPDAQIADFDGDGRPDILIGDDDGDFMIYRRTAGGAFEQLWSDENDGEGGSEYMAAGDINGDGRSEAIVAFHARTGESFQHEYDVPFWTVKVFTFAPDGTASLLWRDSIAYVRPTLPFLFFGGISAGNLDRRAGDEVALSFYPSLYVFTWDSAARTLRPFWFREGTLSNKPIIADLDGDGVNEIGVGDGERITFHQINATFPGPQAPSGFQGWALNDSSAYLEWNPVPNIDYYTLYRAVSIPGDDRLHFDSVTRTTSTSIIDTGFRFAEGRLEPGRFYYYIVTSRNLALAPDDSLLSNGVILFTHNPARVAEAQSASPREIRVRMSFRVRDRLYEPGAIEVRGASDGRLRPVSAIVSLDRESLLVTLADDSSEETLLVRPTFLFRDFYDTPGDTAAAATVVMKRLEEPGERFIATRATPLGGDTIAIDFDADLDPVTAGAIGNYAIAPGGTIVAATVASDNPRRVLLLLNGDYPIGALGRIYTVTITNVRSADGRVINDGAGSVVGFTITASDLANVFVYPHPYSLTRDAVVTFAGLTRAAQVRIFTQSGRLIRTLAAREGNGGAEWNGEDERGEKVPAGIYLYMVSGTAADGSTFESEPRKIAIVP